MLDELLTLVGLGGRRGAGLSVPLPRATPTAAPGGIELRDEGADEREYSSAGSGAAAGAFEAPAWARGPAAASGAGAWPGGAAGADAAAQPGEGADTGGGGAARDERFAVPGGAAQVNIAHYYARLPDDLTRNGLTRLNV